MSLSKALVAAAVPLAAARPGPYGSCIDGVDCAPPMGWRSWNAYWGNVNQSLMQKTVDEMVNKTEFSDEDPLASRAGCKIFWEQMAFQGPH